MTENLKPVQKKTGIRIRSFNQLNQTVYEHHPESETVHDKKRHPLHVSQMDAVFNF